MEENCDRGRKFQLLYSKLPVEKYMDGKMVFYLQGLVPVQCDISIPVSEQTAPV